MGNYINKGNDGFASLCNSKFVDKSMLIAEVNSVMMTENRFLCVTRARRLGQGAGEIMLGCAMLIKNSVGMAAIIVLFFIVLTPLVKTLIFSLMYRLLSAALQPVSDNRIVEGIEAVARAGNLYYIVIRDAAILFFIVIAIVCASTSFMGG